MQFSILGDPEAVSGGEGKSNKRAKKKSFLTFLQRIFFRPLIRLSRAPTNCPWVSEDGNLVLIVSNIELVCVVSSTDIICKYCKFYENIGILLSDVSN